MASISANGANGHHKFVLTVTETDTSTSNNTSTLYWEFAIEPITSGYDFYTIGGTIVVYIDGSEVANSYAQRDFDGSNRTVWASGTTTVTHNSDGTKKGMPFSFSYSQSSSASYTPGNASKSGTMDLTTIPRYANITQFDLSSTLEGIQYQWNADAACDAQRYSLNGGDWVDGQYPTTYINNLSPGTQYSVKIAVRRADSQLWSYSDTKYITTKPISTINSAPNINFGDTATISKTNNSGVSDRLKLEIVDPFILVATRENVGSSYTLELTDTEWDTLYNNLPDNGNQLTIRFVIDTLGAYNTYYSFLDRTLTLTGNHKTIRKNINNAWKRGKAWINKNGTWKRAVVWKNIEGSWKRGI